ncbi:anion permease [Liquorilactobacillus uvarum]|uniref:Uncharacterized protein n=1 Tax=Liquorilactobacillus uvarum DSM 19971 TaxID=1423812 RepID=A0A0R1Q579_9LACO|nr:hypothetical protein FD20_GL000336 [Liquorilactobacillus uvarum DSM 19971]
MTVIFIAALILWIMVSFIHVDATLTSTITGILLWQNVLRESRAWNTLTWFSVLIMMGH